MRQVILTGTGSDNGLSPIRRQAIIGTNAGILLICTLGTNSSKILTEIHAFSFTKMHLNMSDAKWGQFCLGLNMCWHYRRLTLNFYCGCAGDDWLLYSKTKTSSNGNISALLAICTGNSQVTDEFPAQRPVARSFDVFFDLRPNKRLRKQSWGWWFETPSRPLWRNCNESYNK